MKHILVKDVLNSLQAQCNKGCYLFLTGNCLSYNADELNVHEEMQSLFSNLLVLVYNYEKIEEIGKAIG